MLVGADMNRPEVVLQSNLCGSLIEVTWLDSLQRKELMHLFVVEDATGWPQAAMLLEQTHMVVYSNELRLPEARSAWDESYYFKPDGSYYGIRGSRGGGDSEETNGKLDAEQWRAQLEPRPAFGDWDSLLRRERQTATGTAI